MKKCIFAAVLLCLVLLCACAENTPSVAEPQSFVQNNVLVPAQNATPYAAIGSIVPGGAMVTSYSADGSCYYAAFNFADGQKAVEFTYDAATGAVLFRSDFTYENGSLTAVVSQATADKGYGYTLASGVTTACKKIETLYDAGREVCKRYTDFSDVLIAQASSYYGTDGGFVYVLRENGNLRLLRSYASDGAQLFTSEYGIVVGTWINFGSFGSATVVSVGADGSYTLLFQNCTHRMSDGTFYAGLDRFVVVNAAFETQAVVCSKNGTTVCEYQVSNRTDGTAVYTYYEYGVPVCSLQYGADGRLTDKTSLDGGDYFSDGAVSVGAAFGNGSVCEVNDDGSFTVVYFDRTYMRTDGSFVSNTTLYAFFDADRRLAGNKYYTDGQTVAQGDYLYNADGSFRVKVTENGKTAYVSSSGVITE